MPNTNMKPINALCYDCVHFRGATSGKCNAFPDQIPEKLWSGKFLHREPFPGDHGIQFVPRMSEFLTISEVADALRVNPKTIYRAVWSKNVPAYKVGKAWRIAKRDIELFRK